jgi:hypothetical protein
MSCNLFKDDLVCTAYYIAFNERLSGGTEENHKNPFSTAGTRAEICYRNLSNMMQES